MDPSLRELYIKLLKEGWAVESCANLSTCTDIIIHHPGHKKGRETSEQFWYRSVLGDHTRHLIRGVLLRERE